MNFKKTLSLAALAIVATFGLTGCSSLTLESIDAADHKIIERDAGAFARAWDYVDSTGARQKMEKCPGRGFFSKNCFETSDKVIRFEYNSSKSGLTSETITIDGIKHKSDCIRTNGGWGDYRCGVVPE